MEYPLHISFKILAIARQLAVQDARSQLVFYVRQKAFKLRESITVYADAGQTKPLYTINADRVLDISARYNFADAGGKYVGSVRRRGMKSLWKAHYEILEGDREVATVREESAWTKVLDGLIGEVPVLGMFTGYLFHPAYVLTRADGTLLLRLVKRPAFFEGRFEVTRHAKMSGDEETRALLSLVMVVLLERGRG